MPQHRNQVASGVGRFRVEAEAGLFGGPLDRRVGLKERTLEALPGVMDLRRRDNPVPFHIEGDSRPRRKDRWDMRIREAQVTGKSQPMRQ